MTQRNTNPLKAQLPAIGLVLGVLFSTFIAVLFTLNIGFSLLAGVLIGAAMGWVVSVTGSGGKAPRHREPLTLEVKNAS